MMIRNATSWNCGDDPEYHIMTLCWWSGISHHETVMMIRNTTSWPCVDDPEYHIMTLCWWSGIPHHDPVLMIRNTTSWPYVDDPEYHIVRLRRWSELRHHAMATWKARRTQLRSTPLELVLCENPAKNRRSWLMSYGIIQTFLKSKSYILLIF